MLILDYTRTLKLNLLNLNFTLKNQNFKTGNIKFCVFVL